MGWLDLVTGALGGGSGGGVTQALSNLGRLAYIPAAIDDYQKQQAAADEVNRNRRGTRGSAWDLAGNVPRQMYENAMRYGEDSRWGNMFSMGRTTGRMLDNINAYAREQQETGGQTARAQANAQDYLLGNRPGGNQDLEAQRSAILQQNAMLNNEFERNRGEMRGQIEDISGQRDFLRGKYDERIAETEQMRAEQDQRAAEVKSDLFNDRGAFDTASQVGDITKQMSEGLKSIDRQVMAGVLDPATAKAQKDQLRSTMMQQRQQESGKIRQETENRWAQTNTQLSAIKANLDSSIAQTRANLTSTLTQGEVGLSSLQADLAKGITGNIAAQADANAKLFSQSNNLSFKMADNLQASAGMVWEGMQYDANRRFQTMVELPNQVEDLRRQQEQHINDSVLNTVMAGESARAALGQVAMNYDWMYEPEFVSALPYVEGWMNINNSVYAIQASRQQAGMQAHAMTQANEQFWGGTALNTAATGATLGVWAGANAGGNPGGGQQPWNPTGGGPART